MVVIDNAPYPVRRILDGPLGAVAAWLIGVCLWPLVVLAPRTVVRMLRLLTPGGGGIPEAEFWCFDIDRYFRPWYSKVAGDYCERGRLGYAWNDGLGFSLDHRVYSNWATYRLLSAFGHRGVLLLGYGSLLVGVGVCASFAFGWMIGIGGAFAIAGGPLLVRSFTALGKPELAWTGMGFLAVTAGFSGSMGTAGILWSMLAIVNTPAAVILAMVAAPALVLVAASEGTAPALIAATLPGLVKTAVRAVHLIRSRTVRTLSERQMLYLRSRRLTADDAYVALAYAMPMATAAFSLHGLHGLGLLTFAATATPGLALYYVNSRLLKINDVQSIDLALIQMALGFTIGAQSLDGFFLIIGLAYRHRGRYHTNFAVQDYRHHFLGPKARWSRVLRELFRVMDRVGALKPHTYPSSEPIRRFVEALPPGARYILEQHGAEPHITQYPSRSFWAWLSHIDSIRGTHNLSSAFTYTLELPLARSLLIGFNAQSGTGAGLAATAERLGASHVITYSAETRAALEGEGYASVAVLYPGDLPDNERELLFLKPIPTSIVLLARPGDQTGPLDPATAFHLDRSTLTFEASAGVDYLIRYRYEPGFHAEQGGVPLEIRPEAVAPGQTTCFMRIRAPAQGPVRLEYRGRYW